MARRLRWTGQQYDTPETRKRRGIWCIMAGAHWFSAVKGIDQSGAARASKPGNMNYEEWKAGKAQKNVDNSTNSGKIRIDTQFFANRGIAKRTGKQLYKSISSWAENIKEHEEKLNNPEKYDKDWNAKKEKKWRKIKAAFMKCKS